MNIFKYKALFFVIIIILILGFNIVEAKRENKSLSLLGKVITVDPGHGGRDPGTRYGTTLEKTLNLEISKILRHKLIKRGAIVYMTREKDEDLSLKSDYHKKRSDLYRRIKLIENNKSDLYLSIHLNWYNDYYFGGVEVLYNNINKDNKRLSQYLTNQFRNDGIKTRSIKPTNLYLYRNTNIVGVLIECGFLSNKNDRYLLKQKAYQKRVSNNIIEGVINYLNH